MGHMPRFLRRLTGCCAAVMAAGCATTAPRPVPPAEIPALEARLEAEPGNTELRALTATSLVAADRCAEAVPLTRGADITAEEAWPVLVRGACLEEGGDPAGAIAQYQAYLSDHPRGDGAAPVRGRLLLAQEAAAVARVRAAEAGDTDAETPPSDRVAVLPMEIEGDERFQPLSRGLAAQISSDLALLDRFSLVERLSLQTLLGELERSRSPLFDSTTTPRFGRVVQAGRLVQGTGSLPADGPIGLDARIVSLDGEVITAGAQSGSLDDLFRLQKELVFAIAGQLGYTVSAAERARILENGTQNLQALLAYSEGLELQARGDHAGAAARFGASYQLDPGFEDAFQELETSVGADVASASGTSGLLGSVAASGQAVNDALQPPGTTGADPLGLAILSGASDVSATQAEQITGVGTGGATVDPIQNLTTPPTPPAQLLGIISITIRIPG